MTLEEMSESDELLRWVLDAHSESLNDIGERCAICYTRMPCDTAILAASGLHRSAQLAAQTARIKALEAAGEGMLELLTDHSHGVALSPPAITQAFGDWLAALSLDYVYVEPVAGPDDAQAGGEGRP